MNKIKITSDSISDLGPELLKEHDIPTFPLMINLGDFSSEDSDEMPLKIYEYVEKTGMTPKTAARSVEQYIEFFNKHKPKDGEIIHFTISQSMSASYANATLAAESVGGVYVVDSRSLSSGAGINVLYACDLVEEGKLTAKEIHQECVKRAKNVQASFVVDSLNYLHKGGRCSGVSLFMSNMLSIKPTIIVKDGAMIVGKKYMAKFEKTVERYIDDTLNSSNTPDLKRVFITYTTAPEGMVERVKKQILAKYPFENVYSTVASGTITSHCGKNTLGILYFNDNVSDQK